MAESVVVRPPMGRAPIRAAFVKVLGAVLALAMAWSMVPGVAYAAPVADDEVTTNETPVVEDADVPLVDVPLADLPQADVPPIADAPLADAPQAANAQQDDLGLVVSNFGVTTVSSYDDGLTFELQVLLPPGVSLKPGAVSTLTLDPSIKRFNNGALPVGATKQTWDEQSRTLTTTWGALSAGSLRTTSINAKPSGLATTSSTFQATGVLTGVTTADVPVRQESVSAPISFVGPEVPGEYVPVTPGSWTLSADPLFSVYAGGESLYRTATFRRAADNTSSFQNLVMSTTWGTQDASDTCVSAVNGTDKCLPRSWVTGGPTFIQGQFADYTTVQNDTTARTLSWGAVGGNLSSATFIVYVKVPADAAPGQYSVPFTMYDDHGDGTKTVVEESYVTVVVNEPAVSALTMRSDSPVGTLPGGAFTWSHGFRMDAPPAAVKDLTVTLKVPANAVARSLVVKVGADIVFEPKKYEYTTDADVSADSDWSPLTLDKGLITVADPERITGIRYVMNDITAGLDAGSHGARLGLESLDDAVPGSAIELETVSISFDDPVAGPTDVSVAGLTRTVAVLDPATAPAPAIASADTPISNGAFSFGATYANGTSFGSRFFLGSDTSVPLEQPYIFVVAPRGVQYAGLNAELCAPYTWAYQQGGCGRGVANVFPAVTKDTGSVALSNGSTLYYARATTGQLAASGPKAVEFLNLNGTFRVNAALDGPQSVLVGMGSLSQDQLVRSSKSTGAYSLKRLSDVGSYGVYGGVQSEIQAALVGLGVTTDTAMMGERSFTVSPSTSVGSVTTIKGSEDAGPIVQGEGVATARPGGGVSYKVDVSNTGSAIYKNFQFIDVLPYVSDVYAVNGATSRGSAFDVTLSGNVKVLVNGVVSAGAIVDFATTTSPERFDTAGVDVGGSGWTRYTGSAAGAKALRVTMAQGVDFYPGDTITLSFDATVPAGAPRDGSVANNSVAYRFQTASGSWFASESPAVSVKSSAPAGDTALVGLAYLDLNGNGAQDGGEPGFSSSDVSLQLFTMVDGAPVVVGSPVSPNVDGGVEGVFSFIGIDPNAVYKVKPVSSNANVTFPAAALDAEGFLIYSVVSDAGANAGQDTAQYVGGSSFQIGDQVGLAKWVKDLRLPVVTKTGVSGSVVLSSVAGTPLTQGTGAFVSGFGVELSTGGTSVASTTTDGVGAYAFTGLEGLLPGDYTLTFTSPGGSVLEAAPAPLNTAAFTGGTGGAPGVYGLALVPGTGASGVSVFYTDVTAPVAAVPVVGGGVDVDGVQVNPTTATFAGSDAGTAVASYAWRVLGADDSEVASGTALASAPTAALPASLADGGYRVVAAAVDLVGNSSEEVSVSFTVDRTAPVVSSLLSSASYVKGGAPVPTTAAGWIALYGVSAVDGGAGMPAAGGISVDASAVTSAAGSYTVRFTATDKAGNSTVMGKSVTYVVAYVGDPVVTVGSPAVFFEMGTTVPTEAELITQLAATAAPAHASASIVSLTVDSSAVDYAVAGTYPVVITATDSLGATKTAPGSVTVRDTIAPVASLGTSAVTFAAGGAPLAAGDSAGWIALFGATATDSGTGVVSLVVDASGVSYASAGEYPVVFTATDGAGLTHVVTGTYTVTFAGAPVIVLGNPSVTYEMGAVVPATTSEQWVTALGATASSAPGTTVKSLVADASAVVWTTPGTYQVVLTVTDSYDNTATTVGTVLVQDTTAPVLTLGTPAVSYVKDGVQVDAGDTAAWVALFSASASDAGTGVASLTVDASGVDYAAAGAYPVVFTATDNAGLTHTVTGTYTVTFAGAPTIAVGTASITWEMGTDKPAVTSPEWITALDVTASSAPGTTVTSLVADASGVDWEVLGTYQVLLTVTDSYDNTATSFGTVVVADTVAPEVGVGVPTLKHGEGVPETAWTVADWLAAFEVSATDSGSGVNPDAWQVIDSAVVWGVAGTYTVELTAVDAAGNASEVRTAELTIQAAPTADAINGRARQDMELLLDPVGATVSTGELRALTEADLVAPDAGGTLVVVDGKVVYTPAPGFVGIEHVGVTVTDDLGQSVVVGYTLEVVAPASLREGQSLDYTVRVDEVLTVTGAATLPQLQGSALTLVGVASPQGFHGSVVQDGADLVFTTEDSTWAGQQTFTFTVRDDLGQESQFEVNLTVVAPVMSADLVTGQAGVSTVTVSAVDLVPGASYSVELRSTPMLLGTLVGDAEGAGSLQVVVPAGAAAGDHHLVLVNASKQDRASLAFTVVAADPAVPGTAGPVAPGTSADPVTTATATAPGGLLSQTGTGMTVLWVALVLVAAGVIALVTRRRIVGARNR